MANIITTLFNMDTKGGVRSLADLRTELKNTDTFTGKAKLGMSALGGALKTYGVEAATAAGAALFTFGVKSTAAFKDAAIEAGRFADATGLAVEDASRWTEVAGDMGVSAQTVEGLFVRLNNAIGNGSPVLKQYGIEVQKTADGQVDVNATMLKAIDVIGRIKDPTERAAAAQKLFGRNYKEAAEIVFGSASQLESALEGVSNAKITTEEELQRAKELRELMDRATDAVEDFQLEVGGSIAKVIQDFRALSKMVTGSSDGFEDLGLNVENASQAFVGALSPVTALTSVVADLGRKLKLIDDSETATIIFEQGKNASVAGDELKDLADAYDITDKAANRTIDTLSEKERFELRAARAAEQHARDVEKVTRAYDRMSDELSDRSAYLDVMDAFDELGDTADKTMREIERDQIAAKQAVIDYGVELGNIPPQVATEIQALIDQGLYAEALAKIQELERERTMRLRVQVLGSGVVVDENGNVRQGSGGMGGSAQGFAPTAGAPGGTVINMVVNAGMGTDGRQVGRQIKEALAAYERGGGR